MILYQNQLTHRTKKNQSKCLNNTTATHPTKNIFSPVTKTLQATIIKQQNIVLMNIILLHKQNLSGDEPPASAA